MKKKDTVYEGFLEKQRGYQIRINVNALEEGKYTVKIMYKNKVIKQTTFHMKKTPNN